jgi:hypothetical protein
MAFVLVVPVLWYAAPISTSRPPGPTRTGLWKSNLYHSILVRNRSLFGAIKINSYHPSETAYEGFY